MRSCAIKRRREGCLSGAALQSDPRSEFQGRGGDYAIEVRLKTGFYETTLYELLISEKGVTLTPVERAGRETYALDAGDIVSVVLVRNKNPQMEIQTRQEIIMGVFANDEVLSEAFRVFKRHMKRKTVYREEP